ncbi:MAG: DUF819 family protein [Candidatus Omnitrophota bacterium]|nr:DUF819 family protein [Candidatus Omnitrophota bacterium]
MGPLAVLLVIVAAILVASRSPSLQPAFRWLPIPLWCYALPLLAVSVGWLPQETPIYRSLTEQLLPIALILLLLGVDLASVVRSGARSLIAAGAGALAIILGAPLMVWLLRSDLPAEAWKGAGSLAGTWTGGTMNLLALRPLLDTPEEIFAPLVVVDAVIAYSWMALLVAASGFQEPINRWLGSPVLQPEASRSSVKDPGTGHWKSVALTTLFALGLALNIRWIAHRLPVSPLVSSSVAWTILLATTLALILSLNHRIRRLGTGGAGLGYFCLYLVLAATGAQASLEALGSAPAWLIVGAGVAALHGAAMLAAGRWFRIPLGLLATASQANIGGVVSAPLVGAMYHQSLAPVGLLLAMAGNALGTYLGWLAAMFCRWLL